MQDGGAVRLDNRVKKGMDFDPRTGTAIAGKEMDVQVSPSYFLKGAASPKLSSFVASTDDDCSQFEGEMIRKATETKLKKYWYCLLGKELYVYKKKDDEKHKSMHSLIGVFIKEEDPEHLDENTVLYPFTLIFPGNKERTYYLTTKESMNNWVTTIKKVIGYASLFDFYVMKKTLGKGKFGLVKAATHKKTGK